MFAEKGYGHVTIEDVCEAAGYTRGAFYSQFESLEELFFLLYDQWAARTAEQVRAAMEGGDPLPICPGSSSASWTPCCTNATGYSSNLTFCCIRPAIPSSPTGGKSTADSCES